MRHRTSEGGEVRHAVRDEIRAIRNGDGFGTIIGRNSFQRPRAAAIDLLTKIMKIYSGEMQ